MVQIPSANRVNEAIELHSEFLKLPVITKATFFPTCDETNLEISTSHRSTTQLNKSSASQTISLNSINSVISTSSLIFTSSEVLNTTYSLDGKRSAVFKSCSNNLDKGNSKKVLLVQIWDIINGNLEAELDVTKSHGDWYFDDNFGIPQFSSDGLSILYTAEAPKPNYDLLDSSKFTYTPDFGEKFTNKRFPTLFLFTLPTSPFSLEPQSKLPSLHQLTSSTTFPDTSFGQAIFLPSTEAINIPRILATGYSSLGDGKKLGIVYCTNRSTAIYELSFSKTKSIVEEGNGKEESLKWECLTATLRSPTNRSARSPRVLLSSFEPIVIFLSNGGSLHGSCSTLHAVSLRKGNTVVLVETVLTPTNPTLDFPGLYLDQLPQSPFLLLSSGPHIILSSLWRSRKVPLLISLKTGEVKNLLPWSIPSDDPVLPYLEGGNVGLESINILGTDGRDRIVGTRSSSVKPSELVVATLIDGNEKVEWKVIKKPKLSENATKALNQLDWTILPLPKFNPSEVILISPIKIDPSAESRRDLPPLITIPHGGPHSAFTTEFSAQIVALSIAGYRIALVNYPGSTGFGQTFIESLPPALGKLDVEATLAVPHFLNTISLASRTKGKKLIMGGSHGGYITAHLTSTFEDEFDAAVMRNPVVDLNSMFFATDIPDWTFTEGNLPYSFTSPPSSLTPEIFSHLHSISPLTNISKVKTPTLLLLGLNDRRVPPDQGRNWYHGLRKNKIESKLMSFEGNGHALDSSVEVELVGFEAGLRWLEKFTVF